MFACLICWPFQKASAKTHCTFIAGLYFCHTFYSQHPVRKERTCILPQSQCVVPESQCTCRQPEMCQKPEMCQQPVACRQPQPESCIQMKTVATTTMASPPTKAMVKVKECCITTCIPYKAPASTAYLSRRKSDEFVHANKTPEQALRGCRIITIDKPPEKPCPVHGGSQECPVHGGSQECPVHGASQEGDTPSAGDTALHHMSAIHWQPQQVCLRVLPAMSSTVLLVMSS